jgi:phosphatidylserine/phosphatidylglycerophosphate/cardiolipin synthase-like enzyme
METLRRAGGDRVAVYDLENDRSTPIYVHAKVCLIDDVFMIVGSDNVNRRSWTHDSEISCAVIDLEADERVPADPAGLGDGSRRLARNTRLRLWCEHLERDEGDDADLVDPERGFAVLSRHADDLDRWHQSGSRGPRPAGRLRRHDPGHIDGWARWPATALYDLVLDPDGRPRNLRRANRL